MTPKNRHAKAILFVNDEPMSTKWFEKTFADEYTIYCANSADSALTMMQFHGDEIAIVVTDFLMPERDGLDLLRNLDQTHPWLIKILVNTYTDKDLVIQAVNQQLVFRVLEKPWDEQLMRRSLKGALGAYQQSIAACDQIENSIGGMRDSLAFIATEFNTPLTVISSCLNMLQNALTAGNPSHPIPQQLKDTLPALKASQRNILVCQNLMAGFTQSTSAAFAASETSPIQAVRLVNLMCTEMPLSEAQQSSIHVEVKHDFTISSKQNLIYLCLTNIVQNALQALSNKPNPSVEIQILGNPMPTAQAGHLIQVKDNGPGIPDDVLARIFANRPTSSTNAPESESGMGLVFCKKMMKSLSGDISVTSSKAGTCVTLHFPSSLKDSS
jgi:two-component system response regulator PhcR